VGRPFEHLADEAEWVAMREFIPAATAPVEIVDERFADRAVTVATVLPLAWPGLVKPDGRILVGLQTHFRSGDLSRDLAAILVAALETAPGNPVTVSGLPGPGPRLQDLVGSGLTPNLHDSFGFWLDDATPQDPQVAASLERANEAATPTARIGPAAYWSAVSERRQLRWVVPDDEDAALDALSRMSAGDGLGLGAGTRYLGAYRAHGLLVPVWDLPSDGSEVATADRWSGPLADLVEKYRAALAVDVPLSGEERRARDALRGQQLTLR
jgi:hypothetical protein